MSLQAWGFLDKMERMSREDLLAHVKPYLTYLVRQRGRKECGRQCPSPPRAAHLPPSPTAHPGIPEDVNQRSSQRETSLPLSLQSLPLGSTSCVPR